MLEKKIERAVKDYAESKGWLTRKWTSPGHNFVPDQIFITPDGRVVFIEFKREDGVCTAGQLREHARLQKHGCMVFVVNSVDYGKQIVDQLGAL